MSIVENPDAVVGGVDTHVDVHVAAAVNHVGGLLGIESFRTTHTGYRQLLSWLGSHGELVLVGVEGTGSYGVGLARYLARAGMTWSRSTARTVKPGTGRANRIRSTLLRPPGLRYLVKPPGYRNLEMAMSKRSGC